MKFLSIVYKGGPIFLGAILFYIGTSRNQIEMGIVALEYADTDEKGHP